MQDKNKSNVYVLGIVAVVAIVAIFGLITMFSSRNSVVYSPGVGVSDDKLENLGGEAIAVKQATTKGKLPSDGANLKPVQPTPIKPIKPVENPGFGNEDVETFRPAVDFVHLEQLRNGAERSDGGRSTITQEVMNGGSILLTGGNHNLQEDIVLNDNTHIFLAGNAYLDCMGFHITGSGIVNVNQTGENGSFAVSIADNSVLANCQISRFQINVIGEDNAQIIGGNFNRFLNYGLYLTGAVHVSGDISASDNKLQVGGWSCPYGYYVGCNGIVLTSASGAIFNGEITTSNNVRHGIHIHSSNSNVFNRITANNNDYHGIVISTSNYNSFSDIVINSNGYGPAIQHSTYNNFGNITVNNNSHGGFLFYFHSDYNKIGNIFADHNYGSGINIHNCFYNNFDDIITTNNYDNYGQSQGFYLGSYASNNIFGDIISYNNTYGVYLQWYPNGNTFGDITVHDNDYGIYFDDVDYSYVYDNVFGNIIATRNNKAGISLNLARNNRFTSIVVDGQGVTNVGLNLTNVTGFNVTNQPVILHNNDLGLNLKNTAFDFAVDFSGNVQDVIIIGSIWNQNFTGNGTGTGLNMTSGTIGLPGQPVTVSNFGVGAALSGNVVVRNLLATQNNQWGVRLGSGARVNGTLYSCNSNPDGSGGMDLRLENGVIIEPSAVLTFDSCQPANLCNIPHSSC